VSPGHITLLRWCVDEPTDVNKIDAACFSLWSPSWGNPSFLQFLGCTKSGRIECEVICWDLTLRHSAIVNQNSLLIWKHPVSWSNDSQRGDEECRMPWLHPFLGHLLMWSNSDIGLLFASLIQGRQLRVRGGRPWNLLWQAWMLGCLCTLRRFLQPWNPTAHCKRNWSLRTMTFQELFLRVAFIHQRSSRLLRQCQQGQICIPSCWGHSRAHPQTLLALCKVQLAILCSHSRPMSRSWRKKLEVLNRMVIFLPHLSLTCSSSPRQASSNSKP